MVEEGKGARSKELTPEQVFAPIKKRNDDKIAAIETEFHRTVKHIRTLPDTNEGHIQKQLMQLYCMILDDRAAFYTFMNHVGRMDLELLRFAGERTGRKRVRREIVRTFKGMMREAKRLETKKRSVGPVPLVV